MVTIGAEDGPDDDRLPMMQWGEESPPPGFKSMPCLQSAAFTGPRSFRYLVLNRCNETIEAAFTGAQYITSDSLVIQIRNSGISYLPVSYVCSRKQ